MPRILVVDDEPLISMLIANWLEELGCEIAGPARSVEEGLRLAGSLALDGAILDVQLGGRDCYGIAQALTLKGVPFAFATGGLVDSRFEDPILLPKPFVFEEVRSALAKLLERSNRSPAAG